MYEFCISARDGLSGSLDYGVVLRVMELMRLDNDEQLEIFSMVRRLEVVVKEASKKVDGKNG